MIAIESGDAWVQDFGDAPSASEHYERWVLEVAAGAAYLDRWAVDNPHTVLDNAAVGHEQEAQRSRVLSAVQRAYALTVAETAPARSAYIFPGEGPLEPPSQDFGLDL
jgi:hypothetical protein